MFFTHVPTVLLPFLHFLQLACKDARYRFKTVIAIISLIAVCHDNWDYVGGLIIGFYCSVN